MVPTVCSVPLFLNKAIIVASRRSILKRADQSPRMLLDSSTAPNVGMNYQSLRPPMCRIKATTASGHLHLLLRPSHIAAGL